MNSKIHLYFKRATIFIIRLQNIAAQQFNKKLFILRNIPFSKYYLSVRFFTMPLYNVLLRYSYCAVGQCFSRILSIGSYTLYC